jgi:uncharacterized membrane protein (DUF4010 family)
MLGTAGLAGITTLAGTFDIDAATVSICTMVKTGLSLRTATIMLLLGLAGNAALKSAIVAVVGKSRLFGIVTAAYAVIGLAGAAALLAFPLSEAG